MSYGGKAEANRLRRITEPAGDELCPANHLVDSCPVPDAPDPIHKHGDRWCWADESWMCASDTYATREEAAYDLERYVQEYLR